MQEDPRQRDGAFARLMNAMRACKERRTCPKLTTRALYFEPNPVTAGAWATQGRFVGPIDRRVMFVCESPSDWRGRGESTEPAQCFTATARDARFQAVREEHGMANCYITNSVKCGPRRGRLHSNEEILACREFLLREIQLIDPLIVVGVGTQATITLERFVLPQLKKPPMLLSIHHYSARGSLDELRATWARQFAQLRTALDRLVD